VFYYAVVQYSIEYLLNGGSHVAPPVLYTVEDLPLSVPVPTKSGYPFLHWIATCANGSMVQLSTSEIPVGTTGNLNLAAVFGTTPIQYDITYAYNGGTPTSGNPTTYNIENGYRINPVELRPPTLPGYAFSYWRVVPVGSAAFTLLTTGLPAGFTGNIALFAIWDPTPVTYDLHYEVDEPNGGVNAPGNPGNYTVKSDFPLEIKAPTRPGYEFRYWIVTTLSGNSYQLPSSGIPSGTTGSLTLTAVWNPNPIRYTITYELDGGTNDPVNPTRYDVESGAITLVDPTKAGYTFQHWMITYDGAAISVMLSGSVIPAATTGNLKLDAIWA
jgi:uncharacterized repeat protein (TIGR02543 family)